MILITRERFKNKSLLGAEIGVSKGGNALNILQTQKIKKLYLIDPYLPFHIENEKLIKADAETFKIAKESLEKYPQAEFIIEDSDEGCKRIQEPLDFVYIDGNHTYEYVKRDIENYYPLVKVGEIIGGHDFYFPTPGVIKAVE